MDLPACLSGDVRNLRRRNGSDSSSLCCVIGVCHSHRNGDVVAYFFACRDFPGIQNEKPSDSVTEIWEPLRCYPPNPIDGIIGSVGMNDVANSQILTSQKARGD